MTDTAPDAKLRLAFFGTPEYAATTLQALCRSRHEVLAAVSQPDRPSGRGRKLKPTPVKEVAQAHNIPVFQPESQGERLAFLDTLAELNPDVCIVVAYGVILTRKILAIPRLGFYNAHASLLPRWRGSAPIQWALLEGDRESGVTIQKVRYKVDSGPVALARPLPIGPEDNTAGMLLKCARLSAELMVEAMDLLAEDRLPLVEQDESKVTFARQISKEDGLIDWTKSADSIDRQVRGLNPWPSAFTYWNGKLLKIHRAVPNTERHFFASGSIISAARNDFVVACGEGSLKLQEVQLEGAKKLCCLDFLNGCPMQVGDTLRSTHES